MKKFILVFIILAAAVVLSYWVFQKNQKAENLIEVEKEENVSQPEEKKSETAQEEKSEKTIEILEKTSPEPPQETKQEVKEFNIRAKRFNFEPAVIEVKEGDRVRLNVQAIDTTHGLAIPDFDVNLVLEPGQTKTVEFVASKKGSYSMFCSVFCGAGHSDMRGEFVVK